MLAINSVNEANLINYCFLAFSGQTAPESCTIQWQIRDKCKRNALECRNSLQVSNPLFKPCSPHLQSVVQQVTLHKSCPFEERSLTHTHAHLHHMTRFQQFTHTHTLFFTLWHSYWESIKKFIGLTATFSIKPTAQSNTFSSPRACLINSIFTNYNWAIEDNFRRAWEPPQRDLNLSTSYLQ